MIYADKLKRIDFFLTDCAFNGAVSITHEMETLFVKGYGKANYEHDVPIKSDTVFRIASITKQFTAAAILKLHEQKALSVEDTLDNFIKNFPNGDQITIHQILTHTSGISNFELEQDFYEVLKAQNVQEALIDLFKDKPLLFKPGSQFAYSVSGFILLGYIIEQLSGLSYEAFLKREIFDPLNLKNTGFDHYQAIIKNRASAYDRNDGVLKNAEFIDMRIAGAGGGLYATIDDLNVFNKALRSGTIIGSQNVEMMFDKQFKIADGVYSGYGVFIEEADVDGQVIWKHYHAGGGNGVRSLNMFYPNINLGFVVLSNVNDKTVFSQVINQIEALLI